MFFFLYPSYHTIPHKYHLNGPGSCRKHLGKSGGEPFNWYLYLEGHFADIPALHVVVFELVCAVYIVWYMIRIQIYSMVYD